MVLRRLKFPVVIFTTILNLLQPAGISETTSTSVRSVKVPFHLTDNRVFIDLTLLRVDGTARTARFWVDTGGGSFLIAEPLARELGLDVAGEVSEEEGERFVSIKSPPPVYLGKMAVDMKDVRAAVMIGKKTVQAGIDAEGMLPGHLLARYQVVIDYPRREFTLAMPGTLKMKGVRLSTPVSAKWGFLRLEAQIEGKSYGFLLDSGAAYTMISRTQLDEWRSTQPDWSVLNGAVGAANMIGSFDAKALMMRIPKLALGSTQLTNVGVVSRPPGTFEKWLSRDMTAPIVGAIAGNVLSAFRVQIDYPQGMTYLEQTGNLDLGDPDAIPLILNPQEDGSYFISGIAQKAGKPLIEGVAAGDKLVKIDSVAVQGKSLGEVLDALRGKAGQIRILTLERRGKQIAVSARVIHLL
jgi:Aspartyl protease